MSSQTLCVKPDASSILPHIGIPHDHPALIEARRVFSEKQCSTVILVRFAPNGTRSVTSLVGKKISTFTNSSSYYCLIDQLTGSSNKVCLDREIFIRVLCQLYHGVPTSFSKLSTFGTTYDKYFQLIFDYAPSTYCIAVSVFPEPNNTENMQLRYSKYVNPDEVWLNKE